MKAERRRTTDQRRNRMRPGPATPSRIVRGFLPRLRRREGSAMIASARQRSNGSAAFHQSQLPIRYLAIANRQPLRLASGLLSLRRAEWGRRPQRPGYQSRSRAFLDFPRQLTLENHRLPLALPQSFGKLKNSHVSLNPLSASLFRPATQKAYHCAETVEDVTSLWKIEEN